ncbi:hypothetical protein ACFSE1_17520 [Rhizobium helianthi]|uniref:Oligosaccharide repeat unit polymerase n=1 Tax=Rhizobium helianthi TaxID=1132695 RepID=A0ABW4M7W4_9HYPH
MVVSPDAVIIAYLICAGVILFAFILRMKCGAWSNPSVVFALFWGIMTLMPVLFVPEIKPSVPAISYIAAAVVAFGFSTFFLEWKRPLAAVASRAGGAAVSPFLSGYTAPVLFLLMQGGVLVCMMANVAYQGFSLRDFLFDPYAIGCQYLGYRYSGAVKPFILSQVAVILNYVASALAGLLVANRRSYLFSAFMVFLCMLPSLYSIAVYADKGTVFLTLAFFYGAVVVGRIRNGSTALLTWRSVLSAPIILLVVGGAIGLAMANRLADVCGERQTSAVANVVASTMAPTGEPAPAAEEVEQATQANGKLAFYVRSYAFGHLFAFSSWYDHSDKDSALSGRDKETRFQWNRPDAVELYRNPEGPTYGFWTFMAAGKYLNSNYFRSLPEGYYGEYFLRPGILQTNIYTFFRGLIYDFTKIGSLFVLAVFGLGMNVVYRGLLLSERSALSAAVYVLFAGYLYTSYIISLFIWSSVIASGLATFVMLAFIGYVDRYGGRIGVLPGRFWRTHGVEGNK